MEKDMTFTAWQYDLLWAAMCDILENEYVKRGKQAKFPKTDRLMIGHQDKSGKEETDPEKLEKEIGRKMDKSIFCLLDLFDQNKNQVSVIITEHFLYEKLRDIKDAWRKQEPNTRIKMKVRYAEVLLSFAGFTSKEAFLDFACISRKYTGHYYSVARDKVDSFRFELITWAPRKHQVSPFHALAYQEGLEDYFPKRKFNGPITIFDGAWTTTITNDDSFLNISVKIPGFKKSTGSISDINLFYGALTGASPTEALFNLEFVLAADDMLDEPTLLGIHRYLNLRRHHYQVTIGPEELKSVTDLQTNNIEIDKIINMTGKQYRILSAGPKQVLIQSRFVVNEDYTATISVPDKKKGVLKLSCAILLNSINQGRVLFIAYKPNKVIYSFTNMQFKNKYPSDEILLGHYSITEEKAAMSPFGSRFVIQEDATEIEVKEFSGEQIKQLDKGVAARLKTKLLEWLAEKDERDQKPPL